VLVNALMVYYNRESGTYCIMGGCMVTLQSLLNGIVWEDVLVTSLITFIGALISFLFAFWVHRVKTRERKRDISFEKRERCFFMYAGILAKLRESIARGHQVSEALKEAISSLSFFTNGESSEDVAENERAIRLLIEIFYYKDNKKCVCTLKRIEPEYQQILEGTSMKSNLGVANARRHCIFVTRLCRSSRLQARLSRRTQTYKRALVTSSHQEIADKSISIFITRQIRNAQRKLLDRGVYDYGR